MTRFRSEHCHPIDDKLIRFGYVRHKSAMVRGEFFCTIRNENNNWNGEKKQIKMIERKIMVNEKVKERQRRITAEKWKMIEDAKAKGNEEELGILLKGRLLKSMQVAMIKDEALTAH